MAGERYMSEEIWKDCDSFPKYQVSNLGNIRNKKTKRLITPQQSKEGYMHVGLYKDHSNRVNVYVHRLVAEAFLDGGGLNMDVDHILGNKADNRADRLVWVTRSENIKRAFDSGLKHPISHPNSMPVKIVETDEVYPSLRSCAKAIGGDKKSIQKCLNGEQNSHKDLHFETASRADVKPVKPFLYDFQMAAVKKARNGSIFNGGVGSGKSRTGLFYYFKEQGGWIEGSDYNPMKNPKDLYIITTAMKRDKKEWDGELAWFRLSTDPETNYYTNKVVVDSWNNIKKYIDVKNAFFVYDEDHLTGSGAWVKSFLKIAKSNDWIILSATPADTWMEYWAVFVANGFYKNKSEFIREHVIYSRYTKYPQIDRYTNTQRLERLRDRILIDMTFQRHTKPHHEDVYCNYDIPFYKDAFKKRWDPFKNEPIQQASGLCYILRRIVNSDESRQAALLELLEDHPKSIIFYNFDYERDILLNLGYAEGTKIAEWSGHAHQPIPASDCWVYLTQYTAGCEGWNTIDTDTIIFYSQNYSYKVMTQAAGRIDRLNTKFIDLYYYHLKSRSGIDLAISRALREKKKFNEQRWVNSWK